MSLQNSMNRSLGLMGLHRVIPVGVFCLVAICSCSSRQEINEEPQVRLTFTNCETAIENDHLDLAMTYFPRNLNNYFDSINSGSPTSLHADWPAINQLIRTALDQKVPAEMRSKLTLQVLAQRVIDRQILNPHDIRKLTLGRISVSGATVSASLYWDGTPVPLPLSFIKEDGRWKIDPLALLPYTEFLLRIDRTVKGETLDQQIEQLVNPLPVL